MAVPSTGAISLGQIRQELQTANYAAGAYTSAATELDDAENGGYKTINICSPSYPLSANPAKMSEWYGYDHDAPCDYSTSSYTFDGGDPSRYSAPTNLLTNVGLDYANNYVLQCDFTQGFSFSMWVRPSTFIENYQAFNDSYQRYYGLWSVRDYQNDYMVNLTYWPNHGIPGSSNLLMFTKYVSAGTGSSAQQVWTFDLSDQGSNEAVTGIDSQNYDAWDIDLNPGNLGQCGFAHLTVAYDPNASKNAEIVKIWWNATGLTGSYASFGNMWTNLNYGNSQCQLAIGHDQFNWSGNGLPRSQTAVQFAGSWHGNIDWYTHTDQYIWGLQDAKDLYNNGSGSAISSLTSIQGNNVEHFTFGSNQSSGIIYGELQQAELQVTSSHDTGHFIRC